MMLLAVDLADPRLWAAGALVVLTIVGIALVVFRPRHDSADPEPHGPTGTAATHPSHAAPDAAPAPEPLPETDRPSGPPPTAGQPAPVLTPPPYRPPAPREHQTAPTDLVDDSPRVDTMTRSNTHGLPTPRTWPTPDREVSSVFSSTTGRQAGLAAQSWTTAAVAHGAREELGPTGLELDWLSVDEELAAEQERLEQERLEQDRLAAEQDRLAAEHLEQEYLYRLHHGPDGQVWNPPSASPGGPNEQPQDEHDPPAPATEPEQRRAAERQERARSKAERKAEQAQRRAAERQERARSKAEQAQRRAAERQERARSKAERKAEQAQRRAAEREERATATAAPVVPGTAVAPGEGDSPRPSRETDRERRMLDKAAAAAEREARAAAKRLERAAARERLQEERQEQEPATKGRVLFGRPVGRERPAEAVLVDHVAYDLPEPLPEREDPVVTGK